MAGAPPALHHCKSRTERYGTVAPADIRPTPGATLDALRAEREYKHGYPPLGREARRDPPAAGTGRGTTVHCRRVHGATARREAGGSLCKASAQWDSPYVDPRPSELTDIVD